MIDGDPVLGFARYAAIHGWSAAALGQFLAANGISEAEGRQRWPRGVRSVAWDLNAQADGRMVRDFRGKPAASWNELFRYRFDDNAALKRSVAKLALSDCLHPVDTLARTYRTVLAMQDCRVGGPAGPARRLWIVLAYSVAVLVWIARG